MLEEKEIPGDYRIVPNELPAHLALPRRVEYHGLMDLEKSGEPYLLFQPERLAFVFSRKIECRWRQEITLWNTGEGNLYISAVQSDKEWLRIENDNFPELLSGFPLNLEVLFQPDRFSSEKDSARLKIEVKNDGVPFKIIEIPVTVEKADTTVLHYLAKDKPFCPRIDFGLIPFEDEGEFRFQPHFPVKNSKVFLSLKQDSKEEIVEEMKSREDRYVKKEKLDDGKYKYRFLVGGRSSPNNLGARSFSNLGEGVVISLSTGQDITYELDLSRKHRSIKFENRGTDDLRLELKSGAEWLRIAPIEENHSNTLVDRNEYCMCLEPGSHNKEVYLVIDRTKLLSGSNWGELWIDTNSSLSGQGSIKIEIRAEYGYLLPTYRLASNSLDLGSIHKGKKEKITIEIENLGKEKLELNLKDPTPFLFANPILLKGKEKGRLYLELDTNKLEIGSYLQKINLETNGYPLEDQDTILMLCFEIFAYLTGTPRLSLERSGKDRHARLT